MLIAGGIGVGVAVMVALVALSHAGVIEPRTRASRLWGLPFVVPLFTTLLGAVKLVTGRRFGELGAAYETMSGAGRFVVSVLVVALAFAMIAVLVAIAFAIML